MARVTALQLLNRVMLYRRQPEVAAFQSTNPEHVATLNALNMAKEDILAPRRYEFDLRHDGQLTTKARMSSAGIDVTFSGTAGNSSGTATFGGGEQAGSHLSGTYVARMVLTGDDNHSDTALRVTTSFPAFNLATVNFPTSLPETFSSVECDFVYSEYLLPDTVREVVRASYDQDELSLEQIDPTVRFDELFPSFTNEQGPPRSFNVGGFDTQTYSTLSTTPDPKLRAIVWPVPDDAYVITYSYYYRHPDFEDGDSELVGVPPDIVNDIVFQATSVMGMAWDSNFAAAHFGDMAQSMANAKQHAYSGSSGRRHTVRSWDSGRSTIGHVEGFPGRVIGGS